MFSEMPLPPVAYERYFAESAHMERVKQVQSQLMQRPTDKLVTVGKRTSRHTITAYDKTQYFPIDVSPLDSILHIDKEQGVLYAESQVTTGTMASTLAPLRLMPLVVPELKDFTCAGLLNGQGIQTTSHRYGCFTNSVLAFQIVLGDGSVLNCSDSENEELFSAVFASWGTLGFVTAVAIKLMPCCQYVRSTYFHFENIDDYIAAFRAAIDSCTFMDGVVYTPSSYVLILGEFTEEKDDLPAYDPWDLEHQGSEWYYQHALSIFQDPVFASTAPEACLLLETQKKADCVRQDVIETVRFMSRSHRGLWWLIQSFCDNSWFLTKTRWGRASVDKIVEKASSRPQVKPATLQPHERERCFVLQDIGIALDRLKEGIEFVQKTLCVYPIWNGAIKVTGKLTTERTNFSKLKPPPYLVDIGIWGEPKVPDFRAARDVRAVQKFLGFPSFWGVSYYSKDELQEFFDFDRFNRVRQECKAEGVFPNLMDKIHFLDLEEASKPPIRAWRFVDAWRSKNVGSIAINFALTFGPHVFVLLLTSLLILGLHRR